jgi:diguanylate cyclase (GGDEF)-like protein/PAS domain S-box-containing protein
MNHDAGINEQAVILVVDDDEGIRGLLRDALTLFGFTVLDVENGKRALALFETTNPDVVLLDVVMPDMDGFEVCLALRQMRGGEHVPIVMLTGIDDVSAISRSYEVGATDFLTKGTSLDTLRERIRYVLRSSRATAQLRISEARLSKAQQIAQLGSWEWHIDRDEFFCSPQVRSICGMDQRGEGIGFQDLFRCIHPDDRERVNRLVDELIQQRISFETDHRIVLPDGTERVVLHHLNVIDQDNERTRRIAGTIQDITARKQATLLEVDRNQALEMILRSEPLDNILSHFVSMLQRQRPHGHSIISLVKGNQLHVAANHDLPDSFLKAIDGVSIDPNNTSCAAAAFFRNAVTVADIETSPQWQNHRGMALAHRIRSAVSVPILSGKGAILGTVALYYEKISAPSQADLELLETLSKLAAVALEQQLLSDRLIHQAHHDALTGLPNRLLLADRLEHSLAWGDRFEQRIGVLYIDLDRFKHVNDSLGHHIGDQLLQQVAVRLRACIRMSDTLARMGGDEFVVVLNGLEDDRYATKMAARFLEELRAPFFVDQRELFVSASIGISIYPEDSQDAVVLLKNADMAMHFAKDQGGSRYQYFNTEMHKVVHERLELEIELRRALERGEFELHYQPQYILGSKRLVGAEALIRWNHPEKGRIPPGKFIPIAEETGLIISIGSWVLREACVRNAAWQAAGYAPFKVAVNVSGVQLRHADFVDEVATVLKETGLGAKWLQLEVTESVVMNDFNAITKRLAELRSLGIHIAIDDFGTGYSTMAYLQWLPVDCLKIDGSFVHDAGAAEPNSHRSRGLIKAFVGLAESFGLDLLAEGVESQEQYDFLCEVGCETGQGYLLDVPMSASELEALCEDFMKSLG